MRDLTARSAYGLYGSDLRRKAFSLRGRPRLSLFPWERDRCGIMGFGRAGNDGKKRQLLRTRAGSANGQNGGAKRTLLSRRSNGSSEPK